MEREELRKRILLNLTIGLVFLLVGIFGFLSFFSFDYVIGQPVPVNNVIGLAFLFSCGMGMLTTSFVTAFKGNSDFDSQIILTLGMPTTYIAVVALVAFAAAIRFYIAIGAF